MTDRAYRTNDRVEHRVSGEQCVVVRVIPNPRADVAEACGRYGLVEAQVAALINVDMLEIVWDGTPEVKGVRPTTRVYAADMQRA